MTDAPTTTRRQFLGRAAALTTVGRLAASALGVGMLVSPRVNARSTAANERLGVAFIGMGIRGRELLPAFGERADVNILAVCDVDTKRREDAIERVRRLAAKHRGASGRDNGDGGGNRDGGGGAPCKGYVDHREAIAHPGVDAVVIASPDHWHAAQIIDAAKAKKDIYCEKPLTLTIREAKASMDAVRKHERVFQTGSQQRTEYDGRFRTAAEIVRSGRLGKVLAVHVGVGESSVACDLPEEPIEPGLDWERWLGPAPMRPYNSILAPRGINTHYPMWRLYREFSGGMMTDWGAHHFDIVQWALDMDDSGPVEIIPPRDENAKIGARLIYANGVEVHHGGPSGITFVGTEGTLSVKREAIASFPAKILEEPLGEKDVRLPRAEGHVANFLDCVRTRERCICEVEVGARSVTVCHLANIAYWHRKQLKWDPKAWEFPGDAEANAWRDNARRKGFELPDA